MGNLLNKIWYEKSRLCFLLWPFSLIYQTISSVRASWLKTFNQKQFSIPIIVVGNLSVGGVGKTPLVIALANEFKSKGLKVGIVSRGYKAKKKNFPHKVNLSDRPELVGDEPFLIAKKTGCPVVIAPKRVKAVLKLIQEFNCELIIADDGLQHYAMGRNIEIAVIDGIRGLGSGYCLPAGPLREPASRLKRVDFIISTERKWSDSYHYQGISATMNFIPQAFRSLQTDEVVNLADENLAAVAGIGNPKRFFSSLEKQGLKFKPYYFPDHHSFVPSDLELQESSVVMTEKDAVKCKSFAKNSWYYLPIEVELPKEFWQALWSHKSIKGLVNEI